MPIPTNRRSDATLAPIYYPERLHTIPVRLRANAVYPRGTVLGQVSAASANEVQTLTPSGTITGGSETYQLLGVSVTLSFGTTAAQVKAAIDTATAGLGIGLVSVSGGPFGTSALTLTYAGMAGNQPQNLPVKVGGNLAGGSITIARTTPGVANRVYAAYASGNTDGTQTARAILYRDVTTDGLGRVTNEPSGYGATTMAEVAAVEGYFDTKTLVGLDANAASQLGKIVEGTVTDGVLKL